MKNISLIVSSPAIGEYCYNPLTGDRCKLFSLDSFSCLANHLPECKSIVGYNVSVGEFYRPQSCINDSRSIGTKMNSWKESITTECKSGRFYQKIRYIHICPKCGNKSSSEISTEAFGIPSICGMVCYCS
jgi:ABC-type antimicrobial peptide transport system ATPase subunit